MKPIFTPSTRQQVADLAERVLRTVGESTRHRDSISRTLSGRYGSDYYDNAAAMEYFDKHGNNDGGLSSCAQLLQTFLSRSPNEDTDAKIAKYVGTIGRWDSDVSDKPKTPGETKHAAAERTLIALEQYVVGHQNDLSAAGEWEHLQRSIEAFRQCQRDLATHASMARRLSATVMPGGASLTAT